MLLGRRYGFEPGGLGMGGLYGRRYGFEPGGLGMGATSDARTSDIPTTADVGLVALDENPAQLPATPPNSSGMYEGPDVDPFTGAYAGPGIPKPASPGLVMLVAVTSLAVGLGAFMAATR